MSWKLPAGIAAPTPPPRVARLGPRLSALFWRVPVGSSFVDVGTDHGLLPWALVESGCSPRALGIDLKVAPRMSAHSKLTFRRGFGLDPLEGPVDVACFAGIGARTMRKIFERRPPKAHEIKRILAQPGAEETEVRGLLAEHGYVLVEEALVAEPPRFFRIMVAEASAAPVWLDEETRCLGPAEVRSGTLYEVWIWHQLRRFAASPADEGAVELLARDRDRLTRLAANARSNREFDAGDQVEKLLPDGRKV